MSPRTRYGESSPDPDPQAAPGAEAQAAEGEGSGPKEKAIEDMSLEELRAKARDTAQQQLGPIIARIEQLEAEAEAEGQGKTE